jgi:putative aldouronate transport system substrate-binding protein
MKKRLLALLLACAMLLALTACGGSGTSAASTAASSTASESEAETETAAPQDAETPAAEAADEASDAETAAAPAEVPPTELPLSDGSETFEVWMGISPAAMNYITTLAENRTYQEIMDRTGVNLSFIHFHPDTQTEQFNLICASGDYPDVMNGVANNYTGGADQGIEDDVFINLLDYLEDYAPHYYSLITSDDQLYDEVTTPDGNIAGFYSLYDEARLNDMGYIIRQDWLDSLSLDKPTTIDELHDVLSAFKDEKGATDALFIPATGVSDYFTCTFGVGSGMYLDGDTIKYGPLEEGFKEYLQLMNEWYSEGLIYHDFPFYGDQLAFRDMDLIGSGAVACFYSETGDMASFGDFSDDPDFLMTAMAPVAAEEGGVIYMSDKAPSRADDIRWAVTTGCEDPELLIQMIDYLYSDEGALLCNYGIEGETFEYDENGTPHFSDLINNNPDYDYRTAIFLYVMDSGPTVVDPMRGTASYTQEQLDSWSEWTDANLDYSHVIPNKAILKAEDSEYSSIMSDIETFMDEMTVKYITGEYSFDTYDTDFVEALEGMNIERCIELYQDAYDEYYGA